MSGCVGSAVRHLDDAGTRIGIAAAGVERVRQPRECRENWPLLDREEMVGREKLVVIDKYEAYVADTINPSKRRCWQFNENVYAGTASE